MCEKRVCLHEAESLCTCKPVMERKKDIVGLLAHVRTNMKNVRWELDYTDIHLSEKRRLCLVGMCCICGGRLCYEVDASDVLAGDDFLVAVYRRLFQLYFVGEDCITLSEFRKRFAQMFHQQDQALIWEWLERPENRSLFAMHRSRMKPASQEAPKVTLYIIIRTGADVDHGSFPAPTVEGGYLSPLRAKLAFQRLIREEKKKLDSRYNRVEQGEDYWEAYQDGYAAALFSRLEVLRTDLTLTREEETPSAFNPADYLPECAECQEKHGYLCCDDEEGECEMLEKARCSLQEILGEEWGALEPFSYMR